MYIERKSISQHIFTPAHLAEDSKDAIDAILKDIDIDQQRHYCKLFENYVIRRWAASVNSIMLTYKIPYDEMEERYNLKGFRKGFTCVGLNISDFVDVNYDGSEDTHYILDEYGKAIVATDPLSGASGRLEHNQI